MTPQEILDKAVLLLVSLNDHKAVATALVEKLGVQPDEVDDVVGQALQRIREAANFDTEEQTGQAMIRLNDLYQRELTVQDVKTALSCQKELQRLTDRYAAVRAKERRTPAAPDQGGDILRLLAGTQKRETA